VIPIHEDLLKKGYLIWVPGSEALPVVRVVAGVPACPAPCRSGPAALPDLRRTSCGTGKASLSSAAQNDFCTAGAALPESVGVQFGKNINEIFCDN
jgi:hypothetical protein